MEFSVSFYLGDIRHCYVESAKNEAECILKVINCIPNLELFHTFEIERYFQLWN